MTFVVKTQLKLRNKSLNLYVKLNLMDKKLTLSLDKTIIESAKEYAKANNISLSKLIESYLKTLTKRKKNPSDITPLVKSLSGVISLNEDFDAKDAYTDYLIEKYK